ncbi:MAG TPA: hypothetical protein VMX36_10755 [Sedimentisphaerales bacterium]|nr:hypothetical protein [Sedimentisphaerales bacterium]
MGEHGPELNEKLLLHAKFAGHTLSEAGKLSFKERDVSFFRIFDVY